MYSTNINLQSLLSKQQYNDTKTLELIEVMNLLIANQ